MGKVGRTALSVILVVVALILLLVLYNLFAPPRREARALMVSYSDVLDAVRKDGVREVTMQERRLTVLLKPGYQPDRVEAYMPEDPTLVPQLTQHGVRIVARPDTEDDNVLLRLLLPWTPSAVFLFVQWRTLVVLRRLAAKVDALRAPGAAPPASP